MQFNEFMEMLVDEAKKHKELLYVAAPKEIRTSVMTAIERGGVHCHVCLKEDGSVSAEQTALSVQFTLLLPGA